MSEKLARVVGGVQGEIIVLKNTKILSYLVFFRSLFNL